MSQILPDDWAADLPAAILRRHPEIQEIMAALHQHRRQQPITIRCRTCGTRLRVTPIPELGSLWVGCQAGCTGYRSRSKPPAPPDP